MAIGADHIMSRTSSLPVDGWWNVRRLSSDDLFRLLASSRRRIALDLLEEWSPPIDLEELAAATAAREDDENTAGMDHVERIATSLHHIHLPMMSDLCVLDYDPTTNQIEAIRLEPIAHSP